MLTIPTTAANALIICQRVNFIMNLFWCTARYEVLPRELRANIPSKLFQGEESADLGRGEILAVFQATAAGAISARGWGITVIAVIVLRKTRFFMKTSWSPHCKSRWYGDRVTSNTEIFAISRTRISVYIDRKNRWSACRPFVICGT